MPLILCAVVLLQSCSQYEIEPGSPTAAELALNVSTSQNTRLSAATTQQTTYRGIQDWQIIPFAKRETGVIASTDVPLAGRISTLGRVGSTYNYLNSNPVDMVTGTDSYLCYGRATVIDGKFNNGSTVATYGTYTPSGISFAPDYICATAATATTAGNSLLNYVNAIMNAQVTIESTTYTWRESNNARLKLLFEIITNGTTEGGNTTYHLIAGSGRNVRALMNELCNLLEYSSFNSGTPERALKDEIINRIKATGVDYTTDSGTGITIINSLGTGREDFPGSINLPDGAVALLWDATNHQFNFDTGTTATEEPTTLHLTDLEQFVYPAELYYYANSRIKTSEASKASNYSETTWGTVLNTYEHDNGVVNMNTRSVAIKEPMRYGVGCLKACFWSTTETLTDAAGKTVNLTRTVSGETLNNFPLTGIFLGGQHEQDFTFTPKTSTSPEGIIYDPQHETLYLKYAADAATAVARNENIYTLSLPTKANEDVMIVLELRNDSEEPFQGAGGVIYPGTKFYLTGVITPTAQNPSVFTKAHIADIQIQISSLAHAFNIIPDLKSASHVLHVVNIGSKSWGNAGSEDKEVYNW